ncbi:MAG: Twin-arginine translocation protein TatA, partial [uncultured Sphingomonas sp.]
GQFQPLALASRYHPRSAAVRPRPDFGHDGRHRQGAEELQAGNGRRGAAGELRTQIDREPPDRPLCRAAAPRRDCGAPARRQHQHAFL